MTTRASPVDHVERADLEYPESLVRYLRAAAPDRLVTLGDRSILTHPLLGILGSARTPPGLVLKALDLARLLRAREVPVIGGFQAPLEREMLRILARGPQPIVIGVARRIDGMRIPRSWQPAYERGQILVIASGSNRWRRATARSAMARNRIVAALADRLLVIHARAGSRTFRIASEAIEWGKEVYCLEHPGNSDLRLLGAEPVRGREGILEERRREDASRPGARSTAGAHPVHDDGQAGSHVRDDSHPEGGPSSHREDHESRLRQER